MQIDFILRTSLFLLALLPVGLIIPTYLEVVTWFLGRKSMHDKNILSIFRTKSIVICIGLIAISIVTYYWWGVFCYQFIMSPILGLGAPMFSIMLIIPSWFCFVPVFREYYSSIEKRTKNSTM
ncbi:MAG: hypothetical protein JW779_01340 [Candidatus Thorarchaeota archaeon]|nr:hypothetical protein [Candidatus Thorarchaeota archaeon]